MQRSPLQDRTDRLILFLALINSLLLLLGLVSIAFDKWESIASALSPLA